MAPIDPSLLSQIDLPSLIGHGAQHVLDSAESRIGSNLGDGLSKLVVRAVLRLRGAGAAYDLSERTDRIESTLRVLVADLERYGLGPRYAAEVDEPSTVRFMSDAIEDAVSSPSEAKRALLGRMVARRLTASTESTYELLLRDARRLTAGLNEGHLTLLSVLMLVTATPKPACTWSSSDEAAAFFNEQWGVVAELLAAASWTRSDVQKLISDGLITEVSIDDVHDDGRRYSMRPRFPFAERFPASFGSTDAGLDSVRRHVNDLFTVRYRPNQQPPNHEPLTDLWLLPAGAVIAALALEAHTEKRILFPEWEMIDEHTVPSTAIVAPLSSRALVHDVSEQRRLRSEALWDRVSRDAPKALGEQMRQSNPYRFGGP